MIDDKLLAKYKHPLKYIDEETRVKARNQSLKRGLLWIALGFGASIIIYISALFNIELDEGGRRGNPAGLILALVTICAPLYGILYLLTLKNRITDLVRADLVAKHPELKRIENQRKADLEKAKSRFLKMFTFTFAGTLILASIIFAIYETLNF